MSEGQVTRMMEKLEEIREIVSRIEGTVGSHEREIARHAQEISDHDRVLYRQNGGRESLVAKMDRAHEQLSGVRRVMSWGLAVLTTIFVGLATAGIMRLITLDREVQQILKELAR